MIKRVLRKGARRLGRYLHFPPTPRAWGNYLNEDFAYAELNRTLDRLMAEPGHAMRPSYTWAVLQTTHLARALGMDRVSVLEFGVAGGTGLVALEQAAERAEAAHGVAVEVHGFDTGAGLPPPADYRDLPNLYTESDYKMDVPALEARLRRARLHLGPIAETLGPFLDGEPAAAGFVSCDVDYYSSTADVLRLFDADARRLMPRVHCYFDDIMGTTCCEFTGERLAIREFNDAHEHRKIGVIPGLKHFLMPHHASQQWAEMMYLFHAFDHPRYNDHDGLIVRPQEGWTRLRDRPAAP